MTFKFRICQGFISENGLQKAFTSIKIIIFYLINKQIPSPEGVECTKSREQQNDWNCDD